MIGRFGVHPAGRLDLARAVPPRAGGTVYEYDPAGRQIAKTIRLLSGGKRRWTYTWNTHNQLVQVTTPDQGSWTYLYDPLGRRVAKQRSDPDPYSGGPADQTTYTWDGNTTIEQHDAAGATTWIYHPVTGTPLAQHTTPHSSAHHDPASPGPTQGPSPDPTTPGGPGGWTQEEFDQRFQAIVTDLVDAPTALITTSGHHTWHQPTTTWGTPTTSPTTTLAGVACPLRFPGQYADPETGLHYNHHRYYDPTTARYLTPDPLGLTPAPNPHTYVPNPTFETDPHGLSPSNNTAAKTEVIPGFGPNSTPSRVHGPWTVQDLKDGAFGRPPRSLGSPQLHHADQMPGSGIHEVPVEVHRGPGLHGNKFNQGVTDEMRTSDRQLHWWYRSQEMGGWDTLGPEYYFNNWPG